jgi:hypothetical protein
MKYFLLIPFIVLISCTSKDEKPSNEDNVDSLMTENIQEIEAPTQNDDFVLDETFRLPLPNSSSLYDAHGSNLNIDIALFVSYKIIDNQEYLVFDGGKVDLILTIESKSYANHSKDNARYLILDGYLQDGREATVWYFWDTKPQEIQMNLPATDERLRWLLYNLD